MPADSTIELELKNLIREVPDFPKPGILFYDITTLLKHPSGLKTALDQLTARRSAAPRCWSMSTGPCCCTTGG